MEAAYARKRSRHESHSHNHDCAWVAAYLRMSGAKVYRLAKERRLPVVRIGKAWRFRKDLLDDWLSRSTASGMDDGLSNKQLERRPQDP